MNLMKGRTPATLIQSNVLVDAFVTSLLTAGIGYLIAEVSVVSASQAMMGVGTGVAIGALASLAMGKAADHWGIRKLLSLVQIFQAGSYVLLAVASQELHVLAVLTFIFFLGRLVSPLRGALPPRYLPKDQLIQFKTQLRTFTLSVVLGGGLAVPLTLKLGWGMKSTIVVIGAVGYLLCFLFTRALPHSENHDSHPQLTHSFWRTLAPREWGMWALLLVAFSVIASAPTMVPYVLAKAGEDLSWLLFISSLIGIAINIVVQRLLRDEEVTLTRTRDLRRIAMSMILGLCSVLLLVVAQSFFAGVWSFIVLMILVFSIAHLSQTIVTIVAWNIQYTAGEEKDRALIIAVFSLTSSVGNGCAQFIGSRVFES
ncbi:MFS transporter [Corynebacterium poyangense]|uniref:MFS transporter n=2 Tax=Corynebacterium poyangense TaxID=2684405 RepID=A0A7H0SR18_9CORY|nr:MFS transporter [Corynebacterium poyangense]